MIKKLYSFLAVILIISLSAQSVAAFPNIPYDGYAIGTGVNVDLEMVGIAGLNILAGRQSSAFQTLVGSPALTNGVGDGLDVTLTWGSVPPVEEDPSQDIVNTSTQKQFNLLDLGFVSASEEFTSSKRLVSAGLIRSYSISGFDANVGSTHGTNYIEDLAVNGDLAGILPILTAASISETVDSFTTTGDELVNVAQTIVHGLAISMPFGISNIDIVTADIMTTTAAARSNGETLSGQTAATAEFFNLRVGGILIPSPASGTIMTVTAGALDLARVSIMPILTASETITESMAEATALSVEVLSGVTALQGTRIDVGRSQAQSRAAEPSVPTAVHMQSAVVSSPTSMSPLFLLVALGGLLSLPIIQRYRTYSKRRDAPLA